MFRNNRLFEKIISLFVVCLLMTTVCGRASAGSEITNASNETQVAQTTKFLRQYASIYDEGYTRTQCEADRDELKKLYAIDPNNADVAYLYGQKLFELGDFIEADLLLTPLVANKNTAARLMSAKIALYSGKYEKAELEFMDILINYPDEHGVEAQMGLADCYYHTGQFQKARNLFTEIEENFSYNTWNVAAKFGNETPYRVNWGGASKTIIPFSDAPSHLPVIPITINGKKILALIDTGCESLDMHEEFARTLGIEPYHQDEGVFAGGLSAVVLHGRANEVKLGSVSVKNVPVTMSTSDYLADSGAQVVLGTNVLKQFLTTFDFPNQQLILRLRSEASRKVVDAQLRKGVSIVPFYLLNSHFILAKGTLHGKAGLNYLLDSGLDTEESSLLAPTATLKHAGIPIPKTQPNVDGGGAGGSDFAVGAFKVKEYSVGSVKMVNAMGVYGVFPEVIYNSLGVYVDGLVSHNFVKNYAWTLDFDALEMIFAY